MNQYEEAAKRYRPEQVEVLFVAKSPPDDPRRYFYFEGVTKADYLWLALMKGLYTDEFGKAARERKRKACWLRRFQADHHLLIDAIRAPISGSRNRRVQVIRERAVDLTAEVRSLSPKQIVLIKETVYRGLAEAFNRAGLPVVNDRHLPFPCSGRQREFHDGFQALVRSGRLQP